MINASIPLAGRSPDMANKLYEGFREADRQKQAGMNRELTEARIGQQKEQTLGDEQKREMFSIAKGAIDTVGYLESGDIQGLDNYYSSRQKEIESRGGNPEDTIIARQLLASGDIDQLKQKATQAINSAQQLGIINSQGSQTPAEIQQFQMLSDGLSDEDKLKARRIKLRIDPPAAIPAEVYYARESGKLNAQKELKGDVERDIAFNKQLGAAQGKAQAGAPKRKAKLGSLFRKVDNTISTIDEAIEGVDWGTSGFVGSVMSAVPGTDAYAVKKTVLTIKANLGFDELQEMRDNSPTGGALGQVAVQELDALQSAIASLDVGLPGEVLVKNLLRVKDRYEAYKISAKAAYNDEKGFAFDGQQQDQEVVEDDQQQDIFTPEYIEQNARKAGDGNFYIEKDGQYYRVDK